MAIRTALTETLGLESRSFWPPWEVFPGVAWPRSYPTPAGWDCSALDTATPTGYGSSCP